MKIREQLPRRRARLPTGVNVNERSVSRENAGWSGCPADRRVSPWRSPEPSEDGRRRPVQGGCEHRRRQVSTDIGVPEDLARFEILPSLE